MKHRYYLTSLVSSLPSRLCADLTGSRRGADLARTAESAARTAHKSAQHALAPLAGLFVLPVAVAVCAAVLGLHIVAEFVQKV